MYPSAEYTLKLFVQSFEKPWRNKLDCFFVNRHLDIFFMCHLFLSKNENVDHCIRSILKMHSFIHKTHHRCHHCVIRKNLILDRATQYIHGLGSVKSSSDVPWTSTVLAPFLFTTTLLTLNRTGSSFKHIQTPLGTQLLGLAFKDRRKIWV